MNCFIKSEVWWFFVVCIHASHVGPVETNSLSYFTRFTSLLETMTALFTSLLPLTLSTHPVL